MGTEITREDIESATAFLSANGLKEQVDSWVGNGPNKPLTAEQYTAAVGKDNLAKAAQATGRTPQEVAAEAADKLPTLIDQLTPGGSPAPTTSLRDGSTGGGFQIFSQAFATIREASETIIFEAGRLLTGLGTGVDVPGSRFTETTK
ncbi:YidB family protein [Kitasatospora sp. NPDC094011]|uniref:YidB family protein n=1 Tax=Kitasatospora sp. NPDC094011 TaxID=3364090 RepID=UPI0038100EAE